MKAAKIIFYFIIFSGFSYFHALAYVPQSLVSSAPIMPAQERLEVAVKDLPEKVKVSVGHKTDFAWTILKAYLITNEDKTEYYELFVQKPDGETWMKVDKEGKVLN